MLHIGNQGLRKRYQAPIICRYRARHHPQLLGRIEHVAQITPSARHPAGGEHGLLIEGQATITQAGGKRSGCA